MNRRRPWMCMLGLIACAGLGACDRSGGTTIGDFLGTGSDADTDATRQTNDPLADDTTPDSDPDNGSTNDSVADVTDSGGSSQDRDTGRPETGATLRVRNESEFRADVTSRFIRGETIVHLAFLRVLPNTVTIVSSLEVADVIEVSRIDERGRALVSETLTFGIDFDDLTPAEYVIAGSAPDDPGPDPADLDPPTITMLEPASDETLTIGSTLLTRWIDETAAPSAVIRISLAPVGSAASADPIPAGPAVGAALDGINDTLLIVLEGLEPGLYEVIGEIDDGATVAASTAPGRVEIVVDQANEAPSLEILSPTELVLLGNGDVLTVEWADEDEDDNAIITFSLTVTQPTEFVVGPIVISPPLPEDPDGEGEDAAALSISGVCPGLYDLVGRIDDGQLVGTARVEGVVRVRSDQDNDSPQLRLVEPAGDMEIAPGESFHVRWTDSDENCNAQISLLLDPDLDSGALDGDEILLVSGLGEDENSDEIMLVVPGSVRKGAYRVAGVITDGVSELAVWAPGIIYFGIVAPPELSLTEPSQEIFTRVGEIIQVSLETVNVAADADLRLYLTNMRYGGNLRVDVTPDQVGQNQVTALTLRSSTGIIPNDDDCLTPQSSTGVIPNCAWPRQFDLEAELIVDGSVAVSTVAPGSVWIRQEVEVTSVQMVSYTCTGSNEASPDPRDFIGVKVTWFGGGFGFKERELEPHAEIHFWISNDGSVPSDDQADSGHRDFHTASESPNRTRIEQIEFAQLAGAWEIPDGQLCGPICQGTFHVITVVEPIGFGRIISPPHSSPIEICFPPRLAQ